MVTFFHSSGSNKNTLKCLARPSDILIISEACRVVKQKAPKNAIF
jgi:hypothetical protein